MKRYLMRTIMALVAMIASFPLYALDFEYTYEGQTLTYTVIDENAKTVKTKEGHYADNNAYSAGNNVSGDLIIPATVIYGSTEYTVTEIGEDAFRRTGLTSVTIPNSVTSIGYTAFLNCYGLTSVTIPNSVTEIGNGAFGYCRGLTSVTIPNSVTSIGYRAFYECNGLIKSAYPNNLKNPFTSGIAIAYNPNNVIIEDDCIYRPEKNEILYAPCSLKGEFIIPETVKSIGSYAFYGCSSLTSVTIPNSVINIPPEAFYRCYNMQSLNIGAGVLEIGKSTDCNPTKVIWQCNTPPKGCEYFKGKINFVPNDTYPFKNKVVYPLLSSFFESEGIVYVPVNPSQRTCDIIDCRYSTEVNHLSVGSKTSYRGIEMNVTKINPYSFCDNDYIENLNISFEGSIPEYAFYDCDNIGKITIPNTISAVEAFAFYGCDSVKEISLNNTGSIGVSAFEESAKNSPAKLSIGETVTGVSSKAFYGCSGLNDITLNNAGAIAANAFQNSCTIDAGTLLINKSVTNIAQYAFNGCSALQTAEINNNGSIGNNAFEDCRALQTAEINNSGALGNYAFNGCSSLEEINIGSVGTVGDYAFANCSSAVSLTVAPTITSLGNYSFRGCSSLGDITIEEYNPEGTNGIKQEYTTLTLGSNGNQPLFNDCPLDEVFIGRKLSYGTSSANGFSPFYRNTSLRTVEISDVETVVYDNEFYGCTNLQNVKIGDGVKSFGKYAFSGCSKIDSFQFGRSVMSIGEEAFSDCTAMTSLTSLNPVPPVCGSQALDDINKWNCTLHVPSDALEAYMGAPQWNNFFFINDDVDPNKYFEYDGLYFRATDLDNFKCEVIAQEDVPAEVLVCALASEDTHESLEIPAHVYYKGVEYTVAGIGNGAFTEYTELQDVVIPETIENIGNEAFGNCPLTRVEVKAIVPPVAQEDSFDKEVYDAAELIVPDQSKDQYKVAAVWKNFKSSVILATSITLDADDKYVALGDEFRLTATVMPEDVSDKTVTWSTSDENVATVDTDGWVRVTGVGTCIITATTTDGSDLTAECVIHSVLDNVHEIFVGDSNVDVYSMSGMLVKGDADANDIKQLAPGIYIIKTVNSTFKIVVK